MDFTPRATRYAEAPRLSKGGRKVLFRHGSLRPSGSSRGFDLPELELLATIISRLLRAFVPRRGGLCVFAAETIL